MIQVFFTAAIKFGVSNHENMLVPDVGEIAPYK